MEKATHHRIFFLFQKIMKELYFLPTIFRMEKIRIQFSYDSMKAVDYSELNESKKFTPALYREKDGVWEGGSTSQFSPVMIFKLWERFSEDSLEVSEIIEVNGRRTFGYDDPIVYKRKIFCLIVSHYTSCYNVL